MASAINNSQQEAEQIVRFNEFALFRGITKLGITEEGPNASQRRAAAAGTAFHNMKNLKEFRIPESVTTIGDEAFKGCDKLETVTLTHKVTSISGKAFYNSNVKNILVDQANTTFTSNDGLLYNKEDELVCYPNGRKTSSLTLPGVTRRILKHAIYKVPGLDSIFIEGRNQSDMIYLANDGIVHHSQDAGASAPAMRIYVNDGSFDQRLFKQYKNDDKWGDYEDCKHLGRYYPLTFNDAKAATLYLGFDTQLPADLRVYLVSKEDSDEQTAMLLNISKKDLQKTIKKFKGSSWDQSPLFKQIYEDEYGTAGGEPLGCIVGDYYFNQSAPDIELLKGISQISAAAHAPFIAAADPSMMNLDSWQDLANPRDLTKIFSTPEYAAWRSFRESDDSRYVALTLPRVLSRSPYGPETNPVETFSFTEDTGNGDSAEDRDRAMVRAYPRRRVRRRCRVAPDPLLPDHRRRHGDEVPDRDRHHRPARGRALEERLPAPLLLEEHRLRGLPRRADGEQAAGV